MIKEFFFQHIAQTSEIPIAIEVDRAEGIFLYGPNGERWIDFISGICVSNVGHGVSEINTAIQKQTKKYLHPMVYGEAIMSPQVTYATKLIEVLGSRMDRVYFLNSGAEAIEGALKVAKKFTGRQEIISCLNAYHGSSHGALSITGNETMKMGYGPLLPQVHFVRFNYEEDLEKITGKTAAFVVEAVQGAGGVILPKPGYLEAVRNRCDETGTLLVLDEIQTGFGRTGSLFAFQDAGFEPDILVLAKSLGGGMPLGAFITRTEVMEVILRNPVLGHITTFGGHPVSCAAGLALLNKIIDDNLLAAIPAKEQILRDKLRHPGIKVLRGKGLLFAAVFDSYEIAEKVRLEALKRGLLTIGFLNIDNGLRIAPPLTITEEELVMCCEVFLKAVEAA